MNSNTSLESYTIDNHIYFTFEIEKELTYLVHDLHLINNLPVTIVESIDYLNSFTSDKLIGSFIPLKIKEKNEFYKHYRRISCFKYKHLVQNNISDDTERKKMIKKFNSTIKTSIPLSELLNNDVFIYISRFESIIRDKITLWYSDILFSKIDDTNLKNILFKDNKFHKIVDKHKDTEDLKFEISQVYVRSQSLRFLLKKFLDDFSSTLCCSGAHTLPDKICNVIFEGIELRNVLAHRDGIIDEKYLSNSECSKLKDKFTTRYKLHDKVSCDINYNINLRRACNILLLHLEFEMEEICGKLKA